MRSITDLRRVLAGIPRPALLGISVIIVTGTLFVLSFFLLGGARDNALAEGRRLQGQIDGTIKAISQSKQDQEYVEKHSARYDELMKSDKLVPHTRRAALAALSDAAAPHGLQDSLSYTFSAASASSLESAQSQPTSGAYRVSVETVSLKIAAPMDGAIYRFLDDINHAFPGAVALESLILTRVPEVNEGALAQVASGSARLVTGDVVLSWRIAQKEESKEKPAPRGAK
jgi:hypothetical protein